MVFGLIDDMLTQTTKIVGDAFDVGVAVITLGEYGELSKDNVSRLIAAGLTVYALSEATGVAVGVIEKVLEDG